MSRNEEAEELLREAVGVLRRVATVCEHDGFVPGQVDCETTADRIAAFLSREAAERAQVTQPCEWHVVRTDTKETLLKYESRERAETACDVWNRQHEYCMHEWRYVVEPRPIGGK